MEYPLHTLPQLAQTLRGLRKKTGLTQARAAAKVGLLPKTISSLETDPETVTLGSLFKLLSALDLELSIRPRPRGAGGGPPAGEW